MIPILPDHLRQAYRDTHFERALAEPGCDVMQDEYSVSLYGEVVEKAVTPTDGAPSGESLSQKGIRTVRLEGLT